MSGHSICRTQCPCYIYMNYARKTDKEIKDIERMMLSRAIRSKTPLLIGLFVTVFAFIAGFILPNKHGGVINGPTIKVLIFASCCGVFSILFFHILQIARKRDLFDGSYCCVCKECKSIYYSSESQCECGGRLEPQEYYNKIE